MFRGVRMLWQDEARNPTGSHKDRALSVAASHAVEVDARA
jgi:threonine synthase